MQTERGTEKKTIVFDRPVICVFRQLLDAHFGGLEPVGLAAGGASSGTGII